MHDNPMVQKRLDDIEDERARGIVMPPYHHRHPEVIRSDHEVLGEALEDGVWALAMVGFYGALIGMGMFIGWVVWG